MKMTGKSIAAVVVAVLLVGVGAYYFGFFPTVASQQGGTLNVNVSDPMAVGWSAVYINITSLSVHNTTGSSYNRTFSTPVTIDLANVTTSSMFLASLNLPAGHYQMIRVTIKGAYGIWNGTDGPQTFRFALVNSNVDVSGQFSISNGATTTVILDFNSAQAIHGTPTGGFTMTPVVSLITG